MAKKITLPDFIVDADPVLVNVCVKWQDGTRRYHIWIDDAGELRSDTLHSNPIVPSKRWNANEHCALDATSKKWSPLVGAILAEIKTGDLIAKARAAAAQKAQREAEERQRQATEKALAVLAEACAFLPRDLADAIAARPDRERLAFVEGIAAGFNR